MINSELLKAITEIITTHQGDHFMNGGDGISCYVWVNGEIVSNENSLVLKNGIEKEIRKLNGVNSVKINVD